MKKLLLVPILLSLLTACKKEHAVENITDSDYVRTLDFEVLNEDDLTLKGEIVSGNATQYGFVANAEGRSPFLLNDPQVGIMLSTPPNNHGAYSAYFDVFYPDQTYAIRAYGVIDGQAWYGKTVKYTSRPRGAWKRMKDFPGPSRRFPVSFTVNGKGYMGCGYGESGNLNDMWEYDPATDTWTQIGNYPGAPMNSGFSFVIGNKAYVGGGTNYSPPYNIYGGFLTFYEFDPATGIWTKLNDVPVSGYYGPGLFGAVGFSVSGFGFVAGGAIDGSTKNFGVFKFDPATQSWEGYSSLPIRNNKAVYFHYGAAFVLNGLVYIGTGFSENGSSGERLNYFYSWNYQTKQWTYIIEVPGRDNSFGVGMSSGGAGYMGMGDHSNDMYQYKPSLTGSPWKQVSKNPDYYGSVGGICFNFGTKTYMGLGAPVLNYHEPNRVYEFTHTR